MTPHTMDAGLHDAQRAAMAEELAAQRVAPVAPTFALDAMHGPVGDYVRAVAPHTEAAAVGIYAAALAAVGALLGRGPAWRFGGVDHHARVWPVLVGATSKGRKGTAVAWGVDHLLRLLDDDFRRDRVVSGLSSAEGLVHVIRDPVPDIMDPTTGKVTRQGDPGVSDKRLLVVEAELGGPLMAMRREGNRLSATLREAWDGSDLRSLVKTDPQRATNPHVALVAAITGEELRDLLGEAAIANGLANRLLPIVVERARLLPHGGDPDPRALADIVDRLRWNVERARTVGRIAWTPAAAAAWIDAYHQLENPTDTAPRLLAVLGRGSPTVRRLALLLALADGTGDIDVPHLRAALALWGYAAASWRYLLGGAATRSKMAEKLLAALQTAGGAGLTRSAIREAVGTNSLPAEAIDHALAELAATGVAVQEKEPTGGRPVERWRHVHHAHHAHPAHPAANGRKEEREEREERGERGPDGGGFAPFSPFSPSSHGPPAPGWHHLPRRDGTVLAVPDPGLPGVRLVHWRDGTVTDIPAGSPDAELAAFGGFVNLLDRVDLLPDATSVSATAVAA